MSAADILEFCVSLDVGNDAVMTECNQFVEKVAAAFAVPTGPIHGLNADGIVGAFGKAPFLAITTDPAIAMVWAKVGLVVAGMTSAALKTYNPNTTHGHVAIVHDLAAAKPHQGFPMASWGQHGGRGKSNTTIRESFPFKACDARTVQFAFARVPPDTPTA